jgi:four helix bundle protein
MGRSYRDLIAWQKAMDLADAIYDATEDFPKREIYGLASQLRRAAVSVPSNIAEGQSRLTGGPFRLFLGHARASLAELETQLEIARRRKFITDARCEELKTRASETGRLINGLLESIQDRA